MGFLAARVISGTSRGCIAGQVKDVVPRGVDEVLELIGSTRLKDSLRCTKQRAIVRMTDMASSIRSPRRTFAWRRTRRGEKSSI